jgi:hypothetical protein
MSIVGSVSQYVGWMRKRKGKKRKEEEEEEDWAYFRCGELSLLSFPFVVNRLYAL